MLRAVWGATPENEGCAARRATACLAYMVMRLNNKERGMYALTRRREGVRNYAGALLNSDRISAVIAGVG